MLQRGWVSQPGIGAAQIRWDAGMGGGEPPHVQFVDDRVGQRMTRPGPGGWRRGCHQAARHMSSRVQRARSRWVIGCMSKDFGAKPHLTLDRAGVGIQQHLGRVVAQAAGWIIRSADPETISLPGYYGRKKDVSR